MTPNGYTLERAIQSGVDNQDSGVGLYAGDEVSIMMHARLLYQKTFLCIGVIHRVRAAL